MNGDRAADGSGSARPPEEIIVAQADQIRGLERENSRLKQELANRPDPERLHHLLLYASPFFLASVNLFDAPKFGIASVSTFGALMVATWGIYHRFDKWADRGGYDIALMVGGMAFGLGAMLGILAALLHA